MKKNITLLLLIFTGLCYSQNVFKNINELSNEQNKIYELVKQCAQKKSDHPNDIHFFDIYSIKEDENYLYFTTYIYDKPRFSCDFAEMSATYLIMLSLKKIINVDIKDGIKTPNYSQNSSSGNISYSLNILDSEKRDDSYVISLISNTPILDSKYSKGTFTKDIKVNRIDQNLYNNVNDVDANNISYVGKEMAITARNDFYGILNREGKILLPFEYQYLTLTNFGILAKKQNRYYFLNPKNFEKTSDEFDNVDLRFDCYNHKAGEDVVKVEKNKMYTLLNKNLKQVLPQYYLELAIHYGICLAKKDTGKQILIKTNPLRETDIVYDEIIGINDKFLIVRNENKYGLIDNNGENIIPVEYDVLKYERNTKSIVCYKNDEEFFFSIDEF
jgi:hypothetical protein